LAGKIDEVIQYLPFYQKQFYGKRKIKKLGGNLNVSRSETNRNKRSTIYIDGKTTEIPLGR
jgi:hypothetical protein